MAMQTILVNPSSRRSLLCSVRLLRNTLSSRWRCSFSPGEAHSVKDVPETRSRLSHDEKKAKISSAWNSSAEAYVGTLQEGYPERGSPPGMAVGYKLAARLVSAMVRPADEAGEPVVVLDVASAGGEPAITIAKVMPSATVHATDVAPAMVELIRKRVVEAGVSNVKADTADGESLTGFGDASMDALTCTWGLMFMPDWKRAIQEFCRVVRGEGVVLVVLWERQEDSVFRRMAAVLEALSPGFEALMDPEALGVDGGTAVAKEMEKAGLANVTVSQFSVPVVLPAEAGANEIWEQCALSTPLVQTLKALEAKGRTEVHREALEIFDKRMKEDWAAGRNPLGLEKPDSSCGSSSNGGDVSRPPAGQPQRVFYMRALSVVGRKRG